MALKREQLEKLNTLAKDKFGGVQTDEFKNYVNTTFGEGSFDRLEGGIRDFADSQNKTQEPQQPAQPQTPTQPTGEAKTVEEVQAGEQLQQGDTVNSIIVGETPKTSTPEKKEPIKTPVEPQKAQEPTVTTPKEKTPNVEPVKTEKQQQVQTVEQKQVELSEKEKFAKDSGIEYLKHTNGDIIFRPSDVSQLLDLYDKYGTNINISKTSASAIRATAAYQSISKYRGANADSIYSGLQNGELSPGSKTWELLQRAEGGETEAMKQAQKRYEKGLQIENVNNNNKMINNVLSGQEGVVVSILEQMNNTFADMEKNFTDAISSMNMDKRDAFNQYKEGNEELNKTRTQMNDVASRIDEINEEKMNKVEELRKKYPGATTATLLGLVKRENETLDKELWGLQREYGRLQSDYQYEMNLGKEELQFNLSMIDSDINMLTDMYGMQVQRMQFTGQQAIGLQIRKEDIERQERQLKEQREYAEEQLQASYDREDAKAARDFAQQIALIYYKESINKSNGKFLTPESGVVLFGDPSTGELKVAYSSKGQQATIGGFTGGQSQQISGFTDFTETLERDWDAQNVGQDTNNPGNIMAENPEQIALAKQKGAIGTYTSPNGRTYAVFPDMKTGKQALDQDLKAKLSGGSSWAKPNMSLSSFADGWTDGPNNKTFNIQAGANMVRYLQNQGLDVNINTPISQIPLNELAGAVMFNEGVDPNKSANIPNTTQAQSFQFTPSQEAALMTGDINEITKQLGVSNQQAQALYNQFYSQMNTSGFTNGLPTDLYNIYVGSLPTQEKNTTEELNKKIADMRSLYRQNPNLSTTDLILRKKGIDLQNEQTKDILVKGFGIASGNNISNDIITSGLEFNQDLSPERMVQKIESAVISNYNKANKDEAINEAELNSFTRNMSRLQELIQQNSESLGPVSGRASKIKKLAKDSPEIQELMTTMQSVLAGERRFFGGTAITETELKAISDFINGDITETSGNLSTKLNTIKNLKIDALNDKRAMLGLPTLTEEAIGNYINKIPLYTTTQQQRTVDFSTIFNY